MMGKNIIDLLFEEDEARKIGDATQRKWGYLEFEMSKTEADSIVKLKKAEQQEIIDKYKEIQDG